MKIKLAVVIFLVFIIGLTSSCKKKIDNQFDDDLFMLIGQSGYTYYTGTPGITSGVGNSPHGFERVRFNSIAQASLDSTGKLPAGKSFPLGSVIVKEIYTSANGTIHQYSIMKKDPSNSVSGNGYLWAEFNADGSTAFSSGKKGDGCISCHSGSTNRDLVRSFDLH